VVTFRYDALLSLFVDDDASFADLESPDFGDSDSIGDVELELLDLSLATFPLWSLER
jgi:hypothetical protein